MDYRMSVEEFECELDYIDVTGDKLPCAKYLFDNYWEGVDGKLYRVVG